VLPGDAASKRVGAPALPRTWTCGLVSLTFVGAYSLANHWTHQRGAVGRGVFDWERAIPFVEWTIVPYLSIVAFFAASFFIGQGRDEQVRHVARLLLALALSVVCYAAFPLRFMFERPQTHGAIGWMFALLSAVDLPYNRAPSLHISVLVILWMRFAPLLGTAWRWALHGWFGAIGVSVLTTYQHHVIDVPAGLAVAALCIAVTARRHAAADQPRASRARILACTYAPCGTCSRSAMRHITWRSWSLKWPSA